MKLIKEEADYDSDKQTTGTGAAAFETVNGESVAVFYNPNCRNNSEGTYSSEWGQWFYIQSRMCVNFVYDLNGNKGPNKVGRDIGFITALYAKNPEVVAPIPFETDVAGGGSHSQSGAIELCANYSDDSRLPNKDEISSMFFNKRLIGTFTDGNYWSSSVSSSEKGWYQTFLTGTRTNGPRTYGAYAKCIRK